MLVSPTRPITPESSWVPCRLPKPTRHPIGFFFPLPYTQVPLYMNSFFFPSPHTQMQLCGSRFCCEGPRYGPLLLVLLRVQLQRVIAWYKVNLLSRWFITITPCALPTLRGRGSAQ